MIEYVEAIPYEYMLESPHLPTHSCIIKIQNPLTSALHPSIDPPVVGVHTVALLLAPQLSILLSIGQ